MSVGHPTVMPKGWQNYPIAEYVEVMRQRLNLDAYFIPVDTSTDSQIEAHDRLTLASALYLNSIMAIPTWCSATQRRLSRPARLRNKICQRSRAATQDSQCTS